MDAATHVEVEDKYDADESFRLPALTGLPGVARIGLPQEFTLEASYLDTADLRLAADGLTLRRRTGGDDDGWHLKVPLPGGAREEIHRPLGRSNRALPPVPVALQRMVRAYVRDESLAPTVRIRTRRTVHRLYAADADVLAEVADDLVTAEVLGDEVTIEAWREIEVELVHGGRDLLKAAGALLTRAGARPADGPSKLVRALAHRLPPPGKRPATWPKKSAAGSAILTYLREQVEALLATDIAVRDERHDSVHKMRVATRRMRSVLTSYRSLFDEAATAPIRTELKWLGGVLGEVRDAEVMHSYLVEVLADLPDELVLGRVRARVNSDLRAIHREGRKRLLTELDGTRYFRLLDALDMLLRTPPLAARAAEPAASVLAHQLAKEHRRLRTRQAAADNDQLLHEVRKAAKRARYAAEAAVPTLGRRAERFAEAATGVQQALGIHQDTVVLRETLRRMGAQAFLAGENGFTFGLLHGLEAQRAEHAVRQFTRAWKEMSR